MACLKGYIPIITDLPCRLAAILHRAGAIRILARRASTTSPACGPAPSAPTSPISARPNPRAGFHRARAHANPAGAFTAAFRTDESPPARPMRSPRPPAFPGPNKPTDRNPSPAVRPRQNARTISRPRATDTATPILPRLPPSPCARASGSLRPLFHHPAVCPKAVTTRSPALPPPPVQPLGRRSLPRRRALEALDQEVDEHADLGRQVPALRVDGVDRGAVVDGEVGEQRH